MRRRGKAEVEIRNILSEVIIFSLRSPEKSSLLYLIFKFCRLAKEKVNCRMKLTDLLEQEVDRSQFIGKEVVDKLSSLSIFEIDSDNYIQIKSRFKSHFSYICHKAGRYWSFISGLYPEGETLKDGIEDEIKKGVLLFNEGFYFECHEFLEEAWKKRDKGKEKSFIKGLIHAAVAFYHLEYKNYKGAVNYLQRSYARLREFEPVFLGVDVKTFLADMEGYLEFFEKVDSFGLEYLKRLIPKIRLTNLNLLDSSKGSI
jgi:predicted metal-dependent hydrolase